MRKRFLFTPVVVIAFACLPYFATAQRGPGDDPDEPNEEIPFDGGLSLVIAAGAGYAIKKARDKRKQASFTNTEQK